MKKTTIYKQKKQELKLYAQSIKESCKGDNQMFNMLLNNYTDSLTRNESPLTEYQKDLLHNYCASLHPKN